MNPTTTFVVPWPLVLWLTFVVPVTLTTTPASAQEDCNGNLASDESDIGGRGAGFSLEGSWAAFDPGANGVGAAPRGYQGAAFDGRYVYFSPTYNGVEHHGEVLRYDTSAGFADADSWATFDPGAHGVGVDPDGYNGAVFDGRYVYFTPHHNGTGMGYHGEVLRYDTVRPFDSASSWATFDAGENGVGVDPDGYSGALFDGRFVYFVPSHQGTFFHGEVLRFDTAAAGGFSAVSSWATFDPGAHGVGVNTRGYSGGAYDGRYLYLAPLGDGANRHGQVLRYDTTAEFASAAAWSAFDSGLGDVGYEGAVFDGQYVYFVPLADQSRAPSGQVLRYDTSAPFDQLSSWGAFDPSANGVGDDLKGFWGAVFDGRFVYFVPTFLHLGEDASVLRYDTTAPFNLASSWTPFSPGAGGVGDSPGGYVGGVFDGQYIYFAPHADGSIYHGEVLRFDAGAIGSFDCDANGTPDECDVEAGATDCNANLIPDACDIAQGISRDDCLANGIPDECETDNASPLVILAAAGWKPHVGGADQIGVKLAGRVELGNVTSESRAGGIQELRIGFNRSPSALGPIAVGIESQSGCMSGSPEAYGDYPASYDATVMCNELVLSFMPPLPNARTYKFTISGDDATSFRQSIELRCLFGDVNSSGRVNAADRTVVVSVWRGAGFTPSTDINLSGRTDALDRTAVVGAWTGGQSCAP